MATIGNTNITISEQAKRLDPDGKIAGIVEVLTKQNEVLTEAIFVEGNLPTGHRTTMRGGLPTVAWRQLNVGVPTSKSVTYQVTDTCGMLEGYSEVDKSIADLNGNTAQFRMSEDTPFLEAMNQTVATTIFYGDTEAYPERFLGLSPRYSSLSAASGANILDAGGTGVDNTSMWLVTWGENTCHMIFPKGSKVGLQHNDKGQVTLQDSNGNNYEGYRTHYKWDLGMSVRDWRYCVRVANIDVSDLATFGAGTDNSAALIRLLIQAKNLLPTMGMGKMSIYCNRTVKTWLDIMISEKANVNLTLQDYGGQPTTMFQGIPIRQCDAILNTEAQIT